MRVLFGLCVILLLGACNRVHTDHPLFTAEDARIGPPLRDGIWRIENSLGVIDEEEDCRLDEGRPVTRWPGCADWLLVRNGNLLAYSDGEGVTGDWERIPFILASGETPILQIETTEDGKPDYQYFGVAPSKVDTEGRVVAFSSWPVLCGPPPPPPRGEKARYLTLELLAGLTVDGDNCTANLSDPVRTAAAASRAWADTSGGAHWIRDSYP